MVCGVDQMNNVCCCCCFFSSIFHLSVDFQLNTKTTLQIISFVGIFAAAMGTNTNIIKRAK